MASLLTKSSAIVKTGKLIQLGKAIVPPAAQTGLTANVGRTIVSKANGAMLPEPPRNPMALVGFGGTVLVGLTLGATISKHIASFLEENDLFVPSDDDDDD